MLLSDHINVGLYSIAEASRLLGIPQNQVRYWAGESDGHDSLVSRRFPQEQLVTFAELMELHFVKIFRGHGVTLQAIRKAAAAAAVKFETDYPFTVKQFDTDGRSIFATLRDAETNKELTQDLHKGQLVFTKIIRPFFKKIDYGTTSEAERYWPMTKKGRVVLDPSRRFGQPIDNETGVPTLAIMNAIAAGDGQDANDVAKWFDIPLEAVKAAVRFERSLAT
jgi:uncharacterized protein (DUF433 family)/DNA-binding transcriptional MerR regulator